MFHRNNLLCSVIQLITLASLVLVQERVSAREWLTSSEQQWLQDHPRIEIAPDPHFPPVEYVNENQQFDGFTIGYLELIEDLLGIEFEIRQAQTWSEVLDWLKTGEVPMTGLAMKTPSRQAYMVFTEPILTLPVVLISSQSHSAEGSLTLVRLYGQKLVVQDQHAIMELLQRDHSQIDLVPVNDIISGLTKVAFGQAPAMATNIAFAEFSVRQYGITNLKLAGRTPYTYQLGFGLAASQTVLQSILNKTIAQLPPEKIEAVNRQWIHLGAPVPTEDWGKLTELAMMLALVGGIVVLIAGVWTGVMRLQVNRKTQEMETHLHEHEQTLRELRLSQGKYQSIFNSIQEVLFETNGEGILMDVSPSVESITKYKREELLGIQLDQVYVFPKQRRELLGLIEENGSVSDHEVVIRDKDETPLWLSISASKITDASGHKRIIGTLRDVSERRQAQEQLQERELLLSTILEASIEGLLVLDTDNRIWHTNTRFMELWQLPQSDLQGWESGFLFEYISDRLENPEEFRAQQEKVNNSTETLTGEVRFNDQRVFSYHTGPLLKDGKSDGRIWSFWDITETENLQTQLQKAQKMEALGQLAGGVAHDFNNLLHAIEGYTSLTMMELPEDGESRENLEQVIRASKRAGNLIRQLLTFSRRDQIELCCLDLNEILHGLMKMIRRVIGEHIEIDLPGHTRTAPIYADEGQIEQLIMNLAVNARDAMPSGGKLKFELEDVQLDQSFCAAHDDIKPGQYNVLKVSDNGTGMPKDVLERIFEPFFTTKGEGQGTGLGLATVYAIVRRHSGTIAVTSHSSIGTCFQVYLPWRTQGTMTGPQTENIQPDKQERFGQGSILVAEDDELVCGMATRILENVGFRVLIAQNGEEALEVFRRNSVEIRMAIVDVVMPKGGGRVVWEEIRRLKPQLPILFTSGYALDSIDQSLLPHGPINQLPKPFGPRDLIGRVKEMLPDMQ